ncbi:Outer envelope protein 64, mitochondrial [Glycine soja]|nr:Outer envelope protein 64, mitochondrial [Glycine soja]
MLKKVNASNPKLWLLIGIGLAGAVVVVAETRRRRHRNLPKEDFGAFVERIELLPIPQPNQTQTLSALTFAIKDIFDVKGYVTGFGNPQWKKTHGEAGKTAIVITALLSDGATCVGKTVMDEFSFGISGENKFYGTPTNPQMPSSIPGGSSSGSAVAVAARLVDFAIGTDTTGCVRIPAAFCGILGFRPSHGVISTIGVLPNAQSLDTVGWFARDPSVLHRVGLVLLPLTSVELKRTRRIIFADDLFQLSKAPSQKTAYIIGKAIENLSGYQSLQHMNLCQYIASNVPSLKGFHEKLTQQQNGLSILKALTSDDGILVIPTVADYPLKLNTEKGFSSEFHDRAFALSSIASISGCCQVAIPLGCHNDCCASISLISAHGVDKFLLNTVLDMYSTLQEQVSVAYALPLLDTNGSMETSELLKEKMFYAYNLSCSNMKILSRAFLQGNTAFKGRLWNKAVDYYTEAINLNGTNATYYSNRAAAYLELGCFQEAEEDCNMAILHDKKVRRWACQHVTDKIMENLYSKPAINNVKAYLRRGTAREVLLCYKEALKDFQHALVLEPQNKTASLAEKRLRKSTS